MCLEPEYFEERQKRRSEWEDKGYLELEALQELLGIEEAALVSLGLLEPSAAFSTIGLREVEVSEKGRQFLKETDFQLIFVRPEKIVPLLKMLKNEEILTGDATEQGPGAEFANHPGTTEG